MKTFARLIPAEDRHVWDVEDEILSMSDATVIPLQRGMKFITSTVWNETERIMNDVGYILFDRFDFDTANWNVPEEEVRDAVKVYLESEEFPDVNDETVSVMLDCACDIFRNGMNGETAVRALEAYTSPNGLKWDCARITGSVQGEEATIYFPKGYLSEAERKEIIDAVSALYFNTGEMVCVWIGDGAPEDPDEIKGIDGQYDYVPIPFASINEVKQWIADYYTDGNTDDVVLYVPDRPVTKWTYETA